jgi:hypothetical protein
VAEGSNLVKAAVSLACQPRLVSLQGAQHDRRIECIRRPSDHIPYHVVCSNPIASLDVAKHRVGQWGP